jgi:Transposase
MELLHRRCCGLDVHNETVVACLRLISYGKVTTEVRTFQTTTAELLRLWEWLAANDCLHVAMEATGVYWKPVWHILDDVEFELVLAKRRAREERAGPQDRRQRCDVAGRTVSARSDPGEIRAGHPNAGDAQPAAHAQATGS